MAITKLNSLAIPPDTVVESDISFPLDSASFTGDLTVDTDTLVVDSTNNRVGVGRNDPRTVLEVSGSTNRPLTVNSSSSTSVITFTDPATQSIGHVKVGSEGDDLLLYAGAGARMRIDSSGRVGIGVTDPDEKLEISGGDLKVDTNGNAGVIHFGPTSDLTKIIGRDTGHATLPNTLDFYVNSATVSRLDARNASFGGGYTINSGVDTSYAVLVGAGYGALVSGDDGGRGLFGTNVTTTNGNVPVIANSHTSYGGIGLDCSWGVAKIVRKGGSVTAGDTLDTVVRFDHEGLKFGNDTATGTALNDYEEGTWPVTLSDGTTTSGTLSTGRYTKIGQVVIARFDALNNINPAGFTGGNSVRISLPFTASSTGRSTGAVITDGIDRGSSTQVNSKVSDSVSYALLVRSGSNLNDVAIRWQDINSASTVNDIVDFCLVYTV